MNSEAVGKAVKYLGWLFIVLIIFVAVQAVNGIRSSKYIGGPNQNFITVEGEGEVFAVPDIAEFTFSVFAEANTVGEAQSAAAEKSNAIIAFLKGEGIPEKDIKTIGYSANPKYEWTDSPVPLPAVQTSGGGSSGAAGVAYPEFYPDYYPPRNQVITGYEVRQTISVKVRDTERAGELISGVGQKGATDIYGPNFTIDDETELRREARQKAIDDAKEKAKQLAKDLDVRLVRIVSFSENGGPWPVYYGKGGFDMAVAESVPAVPDLPTGENQITSFVTITYEIR